MPPVQDAPQDSTGFDPDELRKSGVDGFLALGRGQESVEDDVDIPRDMFLFDAEGGLSFSDVGWGLIIFLDPVAGLQPSFITCARNRAG